MFSILLCNNNNSKSLRINDKMKEYIKLKTQDYIERIIKEREKTKITKINILS